MSSVTSCLANPFLSVVHLNKLCGQPFLSVVQFNKLCGQPFLVSCPPSQVVWPTLSCQLSSVTSCLTNPFLSVVQCNKLFDQPFLVSCPPSQVVWPALSCRLSSLTNCVASLSCRLSSFHSVPETPAADRWCLPVTASNGLCVAGLFVCVSNVLMQTQLVSDGNHNIAVHD